MSAVELDLVGLLSVGFAHSLPSAEFRERVMEHVAAARTVEAARPAPGACDRDPAASQQPPPGADDEPGEDT